MTEPKVEFDLNGIEDDDVREQFDQFRRWYEYREDRGTPAMQTFDGTVATDEVRSHSVPGKIYGYSGMALQSGALWRPMFTPTGPSGTGSAAYFTNSVDNVDGNLIHVKGGTLSSYDYPYRITVFYRD